jgi:NAD(P)H-hydrate epimerase
LSHVGELPYLSATQLADLLRLLREQAGVSPEQIIERAGHSLALLAQRLLADDLVDRPVVVLAGRGSNGAGGLAAARHLIEHGAWVQIVLTHPPGEYQTAAGQQLAALATLGAPLAWAEEGWELPPADLVIDALIGCGLHGAPHGKARELIHLANSSVAPLLSLVAPSGLDVNSGALATPHIAAAATLALALPTVGLVRQPGRSACGALYLADLGIPLHLYAQLGLTVPPHLGRDPITPWNVENERALTNA